MIVIAFSIVAGVALSISVTHALLWLRRPSEKAYFFASIMSFAAGISALLEMSLSKTADVQTANVLLLWMNSVIFLLLVAMVWFVHSYLKLSRSWLLYAITAIWTLCVIINWAFPGNLTFSNLEMMRANVSGWGETWYQPVGKKNPFVVLADFATLLIIFFVADATVRSFRAKDRRKSTVVGGSILFFIVVAGVQTPLIDANILQTPYMLSWAFVAIAISLGIELVDQALKTIALRKQVEESEGRWRTLLENVDLGVVGLTTDGKINFTNRFIEKLLDYSPDELLGNNLVDMVPAQWRDAIQQRLHLAKTKGPRKHTEIPLVAANGETKHIRWSTVGLYNNGGEINGFMAICEDVTALKHTEAELRTSERTIERFDRAAFLVEIGSSLAHELNQPLAAILSNAQAGKRMLSFDPIPVDEITEILTDIADDDVRAGQVIRSMRRLLQNADMKFVETELGYVISQVHQILSGELAQARIAFNVDIPDELPKILVGKIEIQQVIMNIVGNAIQALKTANTPSPAICIKARANGKKVCVQIHDNGPGMDKHTRSQLFEPFFTTRSDGLGMGLSISQRIVELHGSKLKCRSKPKEGTLFEFEVPIAGEAKTIGPQREFAHDLHR